MPPFFILLQLLQLLTGCYSIWQMVWGVNLQLNCYWLTCLTYIRLLHYLRENCFPARQHVSIPCISDDQVTAVWNSVYINRHLPRLFIPPDSCLGKCLCIWRVQSGLRSAQDASFCTRMC